MCWQDVTNNLISRKVSKMESGGQKATFILAKPWILPFVIMTGLVSAWAAPWSFGDASTARILSVLIPLIIQSILSAVTAILAFLGKEAWLALLIATFVITGINAFGFSLGLWGVQLPGTQKLFLILSFISLIPTFIWGRKNVNFQVTGDVPTWNAENPHSDW